MAASTSCRWWTSTAGNDTVVEEEGKGQRQSPVGGGNHTAVIGFGRGRDFGLGARATRRDAFSCRRLLHPSASSASPSSFATSFSLRRYAQKNPRKGPSHFRTALLPLLCARAQGRRDQPRQGPGSECEFYGYHVHVYELFIQLFLYSRGQRRGNILFLSMNTMPSLCKLSLYYIVTSH